MSTGLAGTYRHVSGEEKKKKKQTLKKAEK